MRAKANVTARRIGRPILDRASAVMLADHRRELRALQAHVAALELLVEEQQRDIRALNARVDALDGNA